MELKILDILNFNFIFCESYPLNIHNFSLFFIALYLVINDKINWNNISKNTYFLAVNQKVNDEIIKKYKGKID